MLFNAEKLNILTRGSMDPAQVTSVQQCLYYQINISVVLLSEI